jgi:hypothetical protein
MEDDFVPARRPRKNKAVRVAHVSKDRLQTRPRPRGQRFDPDSPDGLKHPFVVSSTSGKRVFCDIPKYVADDADPSRRATALDRAMAVCMAELDIRIHNMARDTSDYDEASNLLALARMERLVTRLEDAVRAVPPDVLTTAIRANLATYREQLLDFEARLRPAPTPLSFLLSTST